MKMTDPGWSWWRLFLSHHGPSELHHCYVLPLKRPLHLCARCLGLYPILVAVVAVEGSGWVLDLPRRWFWTFLLVAPAVIDWSRARLFGSPGRNDVRTMTGASAGLGLGLAFSDYFRVQASYFWILIGVLLLLILVIWWINRPG